MGIKHFFIWFKENFPESMKSINANREKFEDKNINVDNLCLDMNGIFHNCAQQVYQYGNFKKEGPKLLVRNPKKGLKQQIKFFEAVCEKVEFYRKIVNPKKRLILCVDGVAGFAKMTQQRQRRFKSIKQDDGRGDSDFDPTCLTPGTKVMDFLTKYVDWYIRVMISFHPDWQNLEVIFSNEKVPGEGEHKIINYIRNHGNIQDSYCIHGLDADLIMLALGTEIQNIYILRENIRRFSELYVLDIGEFRRGLVYHMKWPEKDEDGTEYKAFRKSQSINDFIFLCFLVGNDFVPNIPTLAILEKGIDVMLDVYKNVCRSYGHLTRVKRGKQSVVFRMDALKVYLGTLAQYEKGLLEEKQTKKDSYFADEILNKHTTQVDDKYNVDFENYKKDFYKKKFPEDMNVEKLCHDYLQGLQWIITYYKCGIPDWTWYYKFFYAPFLSELANYCSTFVSKDYPKTSPVDPLLQLMCVLPPQCSYLLPSPLDRSIGDSDAPLARYYPTEFDIDLSGKRREWEGIVVLPMVNITDVNNEYKRVLGQVNEIDNKRNKIGRSYQYTVKEGDFYYFRSYYGDINVCKAKHEVITL